MAEADRIRIVHVVYGFGVGGLENVIVQLINRLPAARFEHVVLALTTVSEFRQRIVHPDVRFIALHKPPGHAIALYPRLYRQLRQLRPQVLHTCNLAALEVVPLAWLARVPLRVHAEHGWDAHDPHGRNPRYQRLRRLYRPFVSHYVAVSRDLDDYLGLAVGVPPRRRSLIANGVDTDTFAPAHGARQAVPGCPFQPGWHWLVGTVGRLQTVKNQPLLARAFVRALRENPAMRDTARLVIVGEGPLRAEVEQVLAGAGMADLAWLPGARHDVADVLRSLDLFVLPSQAEGTSCTLQEAMACGLPVVATAVGGTPDLVREGVTGHLVAPDDEVALARALVQAFSCPGDAARQGRAARDEAVQRFGLRGMLRQYQQLFDPFADPINA
ncbi:TIGR03088 family PEP-CTERM/XrtA system glycosyltransferase [Diaphorobacter sp.]|uniref:TIGR03088 family PEP-CTERM/XrtA system glycosyltransferase n=1 Tax=Diaphorobacter sp. TaxID=1934310 RepID=UPI003D0B0080